MNSFRVNIAICLLLIVFYVEVGYSEEISCKQIGSLYGKDINSFLKLVRLKNCREHIPKLVEILEKDPIYLGKQAAEILAIMGKKEKAISVYLKHMKTLGDSIDNIILVNNLLILGPKSAVPELIKILENKAYVDRYMISEALSGLLSINDIPLLVNLLKNKDSEIRQITIELLGQIKDKKQLRY
ncbi:MAG: HEAT repeat domain-containing protein [Candidatus Anstonellales archaeon]